jgi:hypothetical protein
MNYTVEPNKKETAFLNAYFEALYWTQGFDAEGTELDEDCQREQTIEALAFLARNGCFIGDDLIEQAGHDFWLTRNGHGAGFWDRTCYSDTVKDLLTKRAEAFGEVVVYDEFGECQYN